jgi:hypothetical protein
MRHQLPEAPPPPDDPPPPEKLELLLELPELHELPDPPDVRVNPPMLALPVCFKDTCAFRYQAVLLSVNLAMGKATR